VRREAVTNKGKPAPGHSKNKTQGATLVPKRGGRGKGKKRAQKKTKKKHHRGKKEKVRQVCWGRDWGEKWGKRRQSGDWKKVTICKKRELDRKEKGKLRKNSTTCLLDHNGTKEGGSSFDRTEWRDKDEKQMLEKRSKRKLNKAKKRGKKTDHWSGKTLKGGGGGSQDKKKN